jgi:hypothetical protein
MNPKAKARERQRKKAAAQALASEAAYTNTEDPKKQHVAEDDDDSSKASSQQQQERSSDNNIIKAVHYGKKFLTSQDGKSFDQMIKDHYQGFVHVPADQLSPTNFHNLAKSALERLRDANYYQVSRLNSRINMWVAHQSFMENLVLTVSRLVIIIFPQITSTTLSWPEENIPLVPLSNEPWWGIQESPTSI